MGHGYFYPLGLALGIQFLRNMWVNIKEFLRLYRINLTFSIGSVLLVVMLYSSYPIFINMGITYKMSDTKGGLIHEKIDDGICFSRIAFFPSSMWRIR